jgi:hypothetical protein
MVVIRPFAVDFSLALRIGTVEKFEEPFAGRWAGACDECGGWEGSIETTVSSKSDIGVRAYANCQANWRLRVDLPA